MTINWLRKIRAKTATLDQRSVTYYLFWSHIKMRTRAQQVMIAYAKELKALRGNRLTIKVVIRQAMMRED